MKLSMTLLCVLTATIRAQDPTVNAAPPAAAMRIEGLPPDAPLSLAAHATADELVLEVEVHDDWHLYGRDVGGGKPVAVEISEGSSVAAAGPLEVPATADGQLSGQFKLRLPLRSHDEGRGLRARFLFMACDALHCLPPMEAMLAGEIPAEAEAPSVLVVCIARDDRAARISGFLEENGFRPTLTTYETVKKEECDAHDLVLIDSPYFENARGARRHATQFPESGTPMVAAGFLGTQVLESQKVTMVCGYI